MSVENQKVLITVTQGTYKRGDLKSLLNPPKKKFRSEKESERRSSTSVGVSDQNSVVSSSTLSSSSGGIQYKYILLQASEGSVNSAKSEKTH